MTDSTKLHIAVDADDTLLDFFAGVIDSMYYEFGVLILKEDCTSWDNNPVKQFPWTDWGYKSWWDWMRTRDWLWATFPAIPGAIGGVHALRSKGHYMELLTSKPTWAEPQVQRWLGKWRPDFTRTTIVNLEQPKYSASDADILVDDKPDNIIGWVNSADDRFGILYRQPWNDDMKLGERMVRVHDWAGVLETVALFEEVV